MKHSATHTSSGLGLTGYEYWSNPVGDVDSLGLSERSNLVEFDRQLHGCWGLGKNFVLAWCSHERGVLLLVIPHYAVADYALATHNGIASPNRQTDSLENENFVVGLLSGNRQLTLRHIQNSAKLLGVEPVYIELRQPLTRSEVETEIIERLIKRYSVSYVNCRAVVLFDIVGFGLLSPFEQMTQLNSLSYSLNSAHSKILDRAIDINFARSSTGDGFYIWNRDLGVAANTNLYHLMHLVLADNAIARRKAHGRTVPLLRAGFHVGSCYEFHQAEGLNPTIYSDIVGDVTIELARMIERALPGQIFVGEFNASLPATNDPSTEAIDIDSISFVDRAQENLSQLNGLVLSGEAIQSIKCYLTGKRQSDGTFTVRKLTIEDKHGLKHNVFNAKINIYRSEAEPILLGIEDHLLRGDELGMQTAGHIDQRTR
jgi:hypothetical protein